MGGVGRLVGAGDWRCWVQVTGAAGWKWLVLGRCNLPHVLFPGYPAGVASGFSPAPPFNQPSHPQAELRQREEDYAAERAARKQQAREAEAAAQRAAAQRALEEAAAAQAVLDAIEEREMLLGITQPTLALVKSHKRAACLHTLLAYGFNEPEAENAVEAAGADQRLATQMLFNQEPCAGFQPVIVDRCAGWAGLLWSWVARQAGCWVTPARFQSVWKPGCIPITILPLALSPCLAVPCPTTACSPTPHLPTPPCCRSEVQDLIAFAAELGLPSPLQAVEDQLAAANGNWEAAHEALQVGCTIEERREGREERGGWEKGERWVGGEAGRGETSARGAAGEPASEEVGGRGGGARHQLAACSAQPPVCCLPSCPAATVPVQMAARPDPQTVAAQAPQPPAVVSEHALLASLAGACLGISGGSLILSRCNGRRQLGSGGLGRPSYHSSAIRGAH